MRKRKKRRHRTKLHPVVSGNVVRKRKFVIHKNRRRLFRHFVTAIQELREERKKEPDRKDLTKIQSLLQSIVNCGHHFREGSISLCKKPLFCERCMNIRKAELGTRMLDWMDNNGPIYGWIEKIKFAFPRNVVWRNGKIVPLMGLQGEEKLSVELSNNQLHLEDDYSDAFYLTLDALEHGKERLQESRANLWKRLRQEKNYLGAISELHFLPYGPSGLYVELRTLILESKKPSGHKAETKDMTEGSLDFNYVYGRNSRSKVLKLNQKNVLRFLDKVFICDAGPLSIFCPEEIKNYLGIFLGTKTFMAVGPLFYGNKIHT